MRCGTEIEEDDESVEGVGDESAVSLYFGGCADGYSTLAAAEPLFA